MCWSTAACGLTRAPPGRPTHRPDWEVSLYVALFGVGVLVRDRRQPGARRDVLLRAVPRVAVCRRGILGHPGDGVPAGLRAVHGLHGVALCQEARGSVLVA